MRESDSWFWIIRPRWSVTSHGLRDYAASKSKPLSAIYIYGEAEVPPCNSERRRRAKFRQNSKRKRSGNELREALAKSQFKSKSAHREARANDARTLRAQGRTGAAAKTTAKEPIARPALPGKRRYGDRRSRGKHSLEGDPP